MGLKPAEQPDENPQHPSPRVAGIARDYVQKLRLTLPAVKEHSERVARLSAALAKALRLNDEQSRAAELAGALHDIGKVHVASEILEKPAGLTSEEFDLIQEIPAYSASIAYCLGLSLQVQRAISQRHERPDGRGYPCGLPDEKICVLAKIIAVADTFDSLTHHQPYRPGCTPREAVGIIRSKSRFQFDPDIVDALTRLVLPPH